MSLEEIVSKYIASTEHVFGEIKLVETCINVGAKNVKNIVESAKAYLQDAKYYRDRERFDVSLASIAYCEGLLDALKMLGAVEFEWHTRKMKGRGKK
jgi:hypothetical protein